jgi:hypothetical protein
MSRPRLIVLSLLAVLALSAIAAATASAGLPTWRRSGEPLKEKTKVVINSDTSRLWAPSLGLVIVCLKDKGTGTIENKENATTKVLEGLDESEVTFEECSAWTTHASGEKQVVQNEKTACLVANVIVKTKSKLAYVPYSGGSSVLEVLEPKEEGKPFTTIVLKECGPAGEYPVEGSVLGRVPRSQETLVPEYTEEAVQQDLLFETTNEPVVSNIFQRYPVYEALPRVTKEDTLKLKKEPAAFESTEMIEVNEAKPEPFGVHD